MVSVILVTYNSEKFIKETFVRLLKQTYKNIEIIIIDNNSKDNTIKSIKEIKKDQKIIKNDRNIGFARANNQGLKISKGEYILTLNHDLYLTPSYIQKIVEIMDRDLTIGSAQGIYYNNLAKTKVDSCGIYLNIGYSGNDIKKIPKENKSILACCAAAAIYRKSALIDIGFFDIRFVSYYEDLDLGIRLKKEGYTNLLVKNAYCIHLRGTTDSYKNLKYSLINKYRILKKYKMTREIKIAKIYDLAKFPIYYKKNRDFIPEYFKIMKNI
jgi:GT2 family glycosyltransferase